MYIYHVYHVYNIYSIYILYHVICVTTIIKGEIMNWEGLWKKLGGRSRSNTEFTDELLKIFLK